MRILIVEDEELAVKKLTRMLLSIDPGLEIAAVTDSIVSTTGWLKNNEHPDLILMDIELSDGQSFEIFRRVEIKCPVVFTTSYDETAVKSFNLGEKEYLLKPIQKDELAFFLKKYSSSTQVSDT